MIMQNVIQHPAMLPYALAYARRGWPVFPLHTAEGGACSCGKPCGNPGKHPRTHRGFKEATTDEEIIRRWWQQWPDANIGLATGEASGILAVDIDPKNGGAGTWKQLLLDHGVPTQTISVDTGSGGWHYYFQRPTDRGACRSKANAIKPGIDTRCDGGYVVAPPSMHASGKRYGFKFECDPGQTDLAPCPLWLLDLLYPQPVPGSAPSSTPQQSKQTLTPNAGDGWLLTAFKAAGWFRRDLGPDRAAVICPWEASHSHSPGPDDSSTVVFRPSNGHTMGWFHCSHAHCSERSLDDVRKALPLEAVAAANTKNPQLEQAEISAPPDHAWQADLQRKPSGDLLPIVSNAIAILTHDEQWTGVLAYDAFAGHSIFRHAPPWYADDAPALQHEALEDDDDVRLVSWLERRYSLRIARETSHAALEVVCQRNAFHPVREYLLKCRDAWDGKQRLPTFAQTYLGAPTEAHYLTAPLRWLICAVRRVFEPGCQADSILVLEGDQGIGKSKALRILFSDQWFADEIGDPSNKDAADALRGKWAIEIGELRWRKSDEDTRKAFISRRVDHFRPAYGRRTIDVPRQCVLAASTNEHDWQTDPTGARRYWAIRCGAISHAELARDRNQLWAEAVVRYEADEPSWLQDDEIPAQITALNARREIDPWEGPVMSWASAQAEVSIQAALSDCLTVERSKQSQLDARRVARILRANGWQRAHQRGPRGARVWMWEKQITTLGGGST